MKYLIRAAVVVSVILGSLFSVWLVLVIARGLREKTRITIRISNNSRFWLHSIRLAYAEDSVQIPYLEPGKSCKFTIRPTTDSGLEMQCESRHPLRFARKAFDVYFDSLTEGNVEITVQSDLNLIETHQLSIHNPYRVQALNAARPR